MVNAQAYLNQNYPCNCSERNEDNELIHQENCIRKNLKELNLRNLNLEGDLDLERFSMFLKVYLAGNPQLGEIKNKSSYTTLIYQNPQEWLNQKYPNKKPSKRNLLI